MTKRKKQSGIATQNRRVMGSELAPDGRDLFGMALMFLVTFIAYAPSMQGGFIWDDEAHVTKPELRSINGLVRIWFDLGATQQYYPLLHSAFWVEHKLWGDATPGYHRVNIFLHCTAACLVWLILKKLKVPGAFLAAAIFALHPVHVESVAWISEQKNTLSAVFYLGAMLAYLNFDESRGLNFYSIALGLFILGLLTKTVTASLPAAILVILWWQRGALSWRRDALPLVPFFALGAVAGLFTAWVERTLIGAQGSQFELSLLQRGLLAGRAPWFYLSKLVWPADLIFVYPRWDLDPTIWWQWLFPIASLTILVVLWSLRHHSRGLLAGWLLFVGTLFPVLGFFNVYPFIFSFVADHFQYLASLGIIAVAAALITLGLQKFGPRIPWQRSAVIVVLLGILATLTSQQCQVYSDIKTLYRTTIAKNPACWMAELNLGTELAESGRNQESIAHFRQALRLRPDYPEAHSNLGIELFKLGHTEEGMDHLQKALRLAPHFSSVQNDLANALILSGEMNKAIEHCRKAIALHPEDAILRYNLGVALFHDQQFLEAAEQYEEALNIQSQYVPAYEALAKTCAKLDRPGDAIVAAGKGVELARASGQHQLADRIESWLSRYRATVSETADYSSD